MAIAVRQRDFWCDGCVPLQALLIGSLYYAIRVLPLRWGTSIGSFLFRTIGQRCVSPAWRHRTFDGFPELTDREVEALPKYLGQFGRGLASSRIWTGFRMTGRSSN